MDLKNSDDSSLNFMSSVETVKNSAVHEHLSECDHLHLCISG